MTSPPEVGLTGGLQQIERNARAANRWVSRHAGWARILRNSAVGYVEQAGSRMAAALSYYSIFASGPVLLLTIVLGSALFGEQATKEAVSQAVQRVLPPGADAANRVAERMVRASTPAVSLALLVGLTSLLGYTRAMATSINVTLKSEGTETFKRTLLVGPLL